MQENSVALGPGVHDVALGPDAHGEARRARVIWPDGPVEGAIWVFHGGRDSTIGEMAPAWEAHRDRGWVLVFPQGQRQRPDEGAWFVAPGGDDPHLDVLLDLHELLVASGIDTHVATGFSSGAHMTWRLACHATDHFDALVPVGQFLLAEVADTCYPAEPMPPVLLVAMADDPIAPYQGRWTPDGQEHNLGARGSLDHVAEGNHCALEPTGVAVQGGQRLWWMGCSLEHLLLWEGGHRWPRRGAEVVLDFAARAVK